MNNICNNQIYYLITKKFVYFFFTFLITLQVMPLINLGKKSHSKKKKKKKSLIVL